MIDKKVLRNAAVHARNAAYAPYSGFAVGAALLCDDGRIFCGCNVENASSGLTCCAERTALFKAISEGARHFTAIAVFGAPNGIAPTEDCIPCGACRQALAEFCQDDLVILLANSETTLGTLLPHAFRLKGDGCHADV